MEFRIHKDGSFDLTGEYISLHECYPEIDGSPIRPLRVDSTDHTITFFLERGKLELDFTTFADRRVAVSCKGENLSRIHDKDIIEFLNTQPNKQGYLKNLIRHDMQAGAMRGSPSVLSGDDYPSGDE